MTEEGTNLKVAAPLAPGSAGSSVPAFFYMGTDERQKDVQQRIAVLDERRDAVQKLYKELKQAEREFDSVRRLSDETATRSERATHQTAQDRLDDGLHDFEESCT